MKHRNDMWQSRWHSIQNAWTGVRAAFRLEPNLRIHLVAAILVIICAVSFSLSLFEWLWIIWCIALVFILELVNSAIEKWLDWQHPTYSEEVKYIKDVMAAAVLIAAMASFVCACFIFLPKIMALFAY